VSTKKSTQKLQELSMKLWCLYYSLSFI